MAIMVVTFIYSGTNYKCSGDMLVLFAIFKKLLAFFKFNPERCGFSENNKSSHQDYFYKNYGKYSMCYNRLHSDTIACDDVFLLVDVVIAVVASGHCCLLF